MSRYAPPGTRQNMKASYSAEAFSAVAMLWRVKRFIQLLIGSANARPVMLLPEVFNNRSSARHVVAI